MDDGLDTEGLRTEWVPCNLCGEDDCVVLFEEQDRRYTFTPRDRFRWVECRRCGLRYLNPRPDPAGLSRFYPDAYYQHRPIQLGHAWTRAVRALYPTKRMRILREKARRAEALLPPQGRMLEVGPAAGEFAVAMRDAGYTVAVVERSEPMLHRLRSELRIQAWAPGELLPGTTQPFDLVAAWNTFEHLPDPSAFLLWAHDLLGREGALLLSAPNVAALERGLLFRGDSCEDIPRHLWGFTPQTLVALLQKCGFHGVRVSQFTIVANSELQDRIEALVPARGARRIAARAVYHTVGIPGIFIANAVAAALGRGHTLVVSARKR